MTVPGFPNLFFLYGPNTNLAHGGSIIFVAECQVRYVLAVVKRMLEDNIKAIECRQGCHDEYNEKVDEEHSGLIWSHPGMNSWYRNKAGRIFSIMPWRLVDYWKFTREPNLDDFKVGK
jgi:4-hydroxyacetophenone monooxygenase